MSEKTKFELLGEVLASLPDSIKLPREILKFLLVRGELLALRNYSSGLLDMAQALKADKDLISKLAEIKEFMQ